MKKTLVGALLLSTTLFGGNLITFVPGTKAKASEVNANFDELASRVKDITTKPTIFSTSGGYSEDYVFQTITNNDVNINIKVNHNDTNNTEVSQWQIVADTNKNFTIYNKTTGKVLELTDGGYIKIATTSGNAPANSDCDDSSEYGRMKVDEVNSLLYICTQSGWVSK